MIWDSVIGLAGLTSAYEGMTKQCTCNAQCTAFFFHVDLFSQRVSNMTDNKRAEFVAVVSLNCCSIQSINQRSAGITNYLHARVYIWLHENCYLTLHEIIGLLAISPLRKIPWSACHIALFLCLNKVKGMLRCM